MNKENYECFGTKRFLQILSTPGWSVKNFENSLSAK